MENAEKLAAGVDLKAAVKDILNQIEREREREIISRRFGLYDRRETLEQIGELLGITRERVRQLEKAILIKLQDNAYELPNLRELEDKFVQTLETMGRVSTIEKLATAVTDEIGDSEEAHVALVSTLAPELSVIDENDSYKHSVAITKYHDTKAVKKLVDDLVATIKKIGNPVTIEELAQNTEHDNEDHVEALASISKKLTSLKGKWGLIKWPTVNPKNIRDKIYVILQEAKTPMHFSRIADSIKRSEFKRKDVTTQAIHNELIKDKRFVLIGRGIYALKEWGYKQGTVSDTIADVLKKAKEPLHRDEIVKRVLKQRQVKETTILLNLQSKPQFVRVAKATYTLDSDK